MDADVERTQVLIVGAGSAGLATAVELADRGIAALVLERRPDSSDHPRATALTNETMDTLKGWGVDGNVRRESLLIASIVSRDVSAVRGHDQ